MNTREQFGKYLLLKKLTEDPLGETFRAGLLGGKGMERVVLLRIFNGQGLDGGRLWQAIQNRASVQQGLKSPNIGDGVGMGEIEGIPYIAYDYVSGKNMANLLEQAARKRNFIPAEHALLITERIALALASAAETRFENDRILHGFLIPHLVMISNEGETRLLGFEVGTGLRVFAGNPVIRQHFGRYMSPEALSGAPPDRVDDIYSLGVILYELITGRPLPPPGPDGFQSVVDQGVVATEGGPIPPPLAELLKQSLVTRDRRIKDIATWHKTLNKYMFEGHYNPTTFNLAFFMHNLFRQEIERESQEIEVEKTLPVPVLKPKGRDPARSAGAARGAARRNRHGHRRGAGAARPRRVDRQLPAAAAGRGQVEPGGPDRRRGRRPGAAGWRRLFPDEQEGRAAAGGGAGRAFGRRAAGADQRDRQPAVEPDLGRLRGPAAEAPGPAGAGPEGRRRAPQRKRPRRPTSRPRRPKPSRRPRRWWRRRPPRPRPKPSRSRRRRRPRPCRPRKSRSRPRSSRWRPPRRRWPRRSRPRRAPPPRCAAATWSSRAPEW